MRRRDEGAAHLDRRRTSLITVEDPTVWQRSWTASLPMLRTDQPIYEFACHEGNAVIMENILRAARSVDKQ